MDDGGRLWWLIVVFLLFCAIFFALTETAFASVSRVRLKTKSERGDPRAKKAIYITENFDRAITTILICTNIVHIAAASVVTANVAKIWGISAVTLSTVLTTLVIFFFGEMLPKSIARKYSEHICLANAGLLSFFMFILKPLSTLLANIGNAAARHTKSDPEASVTEDEIYDIIDDMTEEGSLDESRGELISSALQFGDITVESILTSRVDVAAVDIALSEKDILSFIKEQSHSRMPVYEGNIDNIIGILQIRKFIKEYVKSGDEVDIRSILDKPYFVHQSVKIGNVLEEMSRKKQNLAIVTDNYGGTLGIVTVEDILEELVGEIWDEDDVVSENILKLSDGSYSVDAEEHVGDVLDELEIEYDNDDEAEDIEKKLMSELAYENFTSIPKPGDSFEYKGLLITIMNMKQNRITRLKVTKLPESEEKGGDAK